MFELSAEGKQFVITELTRYESKRSAVIPCLYKAQKENGGWVSPEVVAHLSQIMDIPEAMIYEVVSFYTMFNKKPVGKFHVQVCCTVSCAMNGARDLLKHLCTTFQTKEGEVSHDGRYTFSRVECLGSCGTAPMMQVNDEYYENLDPVSAVRILRELK